MSTPDLPGSDGVRKKDGALHGGVFLAAWGVIAFGLPPLAWPWYLVLPLATYAAVVIIWPRPRRTVPRLSMGRLGGLPLLSAAILSAATTAVLLIFHSLAQPDVSALAARISVAAFGSVVLAGVCFSVANATLEELIFRGVLYEAIAAEWNAATAIGVTALLFGLGHLQGYPPGLLGGILAGGNGLALGLLRWWTGGLGLAMACHICADATIFAILSAAGAFDATHL